MKKIFASILVVMLSFNMFSGVLAAEFSRNEFLKKYEELEQLIRKCENRGINVDKERVLASTMERFIDEVAFDVELDENLKSEGTSLEEKTKRSVSYQIDVLNGFYNKAKAALEGYLTGTEFSDSVDSIYDPKQIVIGDNGVCIDDNPYYSVGYGHFHTAQKDIGILESLGAEHISMVIYPEYVLESVSETDKTYTNAGAKRDETVTSIQTKLVEAESSGVGINLLLSPNNAPDWFLKMYPEVDTVGDTWCKYNIFHDTSKEMISAYFEGVLPALKGYSALESIILTNEPKLVTYKYPSVFKTEFNRYLMAKYEKISVLNEAWGGTGYTSWSQISMPEYDLETGLPVTYDALFYDWQAYNNEKLAKWHKWVAEEVRKHLPEVKISIKTLDYLWSDDNNDTCRGYWITGNDIERYSEFCDYAGIDSHGNISDYKQIIAKYMYYDFVRSLTGQPVYNSEDHMFYDNYLRFGDKETIQDEHVAASIWQGAVHGCEKTTLWTWERLNYTPDDEETWTDAVDKELGSIYNATFLHRPEAVVAAGMTAIDLRRLNDEVRLVEKAKNDVAILYSNSARIYNLDFMKTMHSAYETMIATGFGVDFVSEYKPEYIHNYSTVVLTGINNIEDDTLKELCKFAQNGGNVILMNSSIENNQYNQPSAAECLSGVLESENTHIISADELYNALTNVDMRKVAVTLTNADGNFVKGIDFKWTENYDGSILVNICNLSNYDIENLTLRINGEAIVTKDLINGTLIEPEFTAKRYAPILIYISGNGSLLRNVTVKNGKTISWKKELFPVYIYNIDKGMDNKQLVGIEDSRFEVKKEGIYYVRKSDNGVVYPGRIISLQSETLFDITQTQTGVIVKNTSDKYAAGVLVIRHEEKSPTAVTFVNLYMKPSEEKTVAVSDKALTAVYNNLSDLIKISN